MKKIIIGLMSSLIAGGFAAQAEAGLYEDAAQEEKIDIEGKMNCTIESNTVVTIEDGKAKTYSGYKDKFVVGDALELRYSIYVETYNDGRQRTVIKIVLHDAKRDDIAVIGREYIYRLTSGPEGDYQNYVFEGEVYGTIVFGPDYIFLRNLSKEFAMKRYYKGDWHGIVNSFSPSELLASTYTFDCRHESDKIDEILETLEDYFKKNKPAFLEE